jgi:hypothetical protein
MVAPRLSGRQLRIGLVKRVLADFGASARAVYAMRFAYSTSSRFVTPPCRNLSQWRSQTG